jgi:CRISPR/Cas system-associated exonuclease Cas4 (RecB family)
MIDSNLETPPPGQLFIPGATVVETPNHPTIARVHALPELPLGAERPKIKFDYLSGSQVNAYRRCQATYLFKYFYGLREPENTALIFGSAVHAGAEAYLRTKKELTAAGEQPTHDGLKSLALEHTEGYVRRKFNADVVCKTQWKKGPDETFDSLLAGTAAATAQLADEIWIGIKPLEVERGFVIEWNDKTTLPFLGYADIILETEHGPAVRDLKTGNEKNEIDARLDIALSSYAQSYELYAGRSTRRVGYDSYVRNKTPKLVSIGVERSDGDLNRLYLIARSVTASLAHGIYIPADDSMKCASCAFYDRCRKEYS